MHCDLKEETQICQDSFKVPRPRCRGHSQGWLQGKVSSKVTTQGHQRAGEDQELATQAHTQLHLQPCYAQMRTWGRDKGLASSSRFLCISQGERNGQYEARRRSKPLKALGCTGQDIESSLPGRD